MCATAASHLRSFFVHTDASLPGLDPNQDTPVEILHVILLGFVKYFWRDLVQNQLKTSAAQKSLLVTRLNSFDVSGLGISPLAGHTLVQYSASLTERDFRAIAQVAPFVVYDLVSKDCLATWVSLSRLIPLIWQPSIKDIDAHAVPCFFSSFSFLTFLQGTRENRDRSLPCLCCSLDDSMVQ